MRILSQYSVSQHSSMDCSRAQMTTLLRSCCQLMVSWPETSVFLKGGTLERSAMFQCLLPHPWVNRQLKSTQFVVLKTEQMSMCHTSLMDAYPMQPLYLRLREHQISGSRKTVRDAKNGRCKILSSKFDRTLYPYHLNYMVI